VGAFAFAFCCHPERRGACLPRARISLYASPQSAQNIENYMLQVAPILVLIAVLLVAYALAPRECKVEGNTLTIKTNFASLTYDLNEMLRATAIPSGTMSMWKTIRLCGVGWPLKPYGYFSNSEIGTFLALVTDRNNMVLITFPKKKLLVSPSDPQALLTRTAAK
jgi:hypothetical protein